MGDGVNLYGQAANYRGEAMSTRMNATLARRQAYAEAYKLESDSEQALHGTCEKFITRFRRVEEQADGKPLTEYPLSELEQMWQKAKEKEHSV